MYADVRVRPKPDNSSLSEGDNRLRPGRHVSPNPDAIAAQTAFFSHLTDTRARRVYC